MRARRTKINNRRNFLLFVGILAVHFLLLFSLKFTAWPEMTLWPYLMTKGWLPYSDIALAYTPLMLLDLSIFYKIFGGGILQLQIFTWGLILFTDILVFTVAKRLWNIKTALLSLTAFVLWMTYFDGNGLWFDLYMGIFTFISFYFVQKKKWIWVGIFWALAFISKQTAVWFLIPIGYMMLDGKWLTFKNNLRRPCRGYPFKVVPRFLIGVTSVMVPFVLLLFIFQLLPSFWNWAIDFGIFVLPGASGQIQFSDLRNFAGAAFPFLIFIPLFLNSKKQDLNLLLWALAGSMGAYPRFELFHIAPAVPYLAIATGLVFADVKKLGKLVKVFAPFYIIGSIYLFGGFFMRNYKEGVRFDEQNVKDVVSYVNYNTKVGDRIFVLNWWNNIYALTDTLPSTDPWIPQSSWYTEIPGIQEKMIDGLKANPPKLIVYYPFTKLGTSSYMPQEVYNYVVENYTLETRVDDLEILIPNKALPE